MKKLVLMLAVVFSLSFASCGVSESSNAANDSIVDSTLVDTIAIDSVVVDTLVVDSVK